MQTEFYVYQNRINSDETVNEELLFYCHDEQIAIDEVDRINSNLAAAGIPSWVSSAYIK